VSQPANIRIVIAICTAGRLQGLHECLTSVAAITVPEGASVQLLVIDNDPQQRATAMLAETVPHYPLVLTSCSELRRGICYARMKAVDYFLEAGADFLAFIDDDETVCKEWLVELMRVQHVTAADIVTGPAYEYFEAEHKVPHWISQMQLFSPRSRLSAMACSMAYTHNILIARRVLEALHPAFDLTFNTSGGEDEFFSMRAIKAGFQIVWCEEAKVASAFPPERATLRWVLRRGYRVGSSWSVGVRLLYARKVAWPRLALFVVLRGGRALRALLKGVLLCNRTHLADGAFYTAQTIGTIAGAFGLQYGEYAPKECIA